MPLLLDTHVIIWLESNRVRIPRLTLEAILSEQDLYLSVVTIWEISIKLKIGKLKVGQPLEIYIRNFVAENNAKILDISLTHIYQTEKLPLYHRDPFDRLLIAQANIEQIPIVSSDEWFDQYEVQRIW